MSETRQLSGPFLRARVDHLYEAMGKLAEAMRSMTYVAACMDAVSTIQHIKKMADSGDLGELNHPPEKPLDPYTMQYMLDMFRLGTEAAVSNMSMIDLEEVGGGLSQEGPPPGVRPS